MIYNTTRTTAYIPILINTLPISTDGSAILVTIVRTIIPRISSITAAPRIVVPTAPFNLPISLSVWTVILTEVAVSTTPTNIHFKSSVLSIIFSWKNSA